MHNVNAVIITLNAQSVKHADETVDELIRRLITKQLMINNNATASSAFDKKYNSGKPRRINC